MELKSYPMNEYQNAIMNIERIYPGTSVCNIGGIMPFDKTVDKNLAANAAKEAVRKISSIRFMINDDDRLYISENDPIIEELNFEDEIDKDAVINKLMNEPFKLKNSQLYQFKYVATPTEKFGFMKIHHILGDHAALLVFFKTLEKIYFEMREGSYMTEMPESYYQDTMLETDRAESEMDKMYFKRKISRYKGEFDFDVLRSTESSVISYKLNDDDAKKIINFSKENRIKLESIIYAGLALYRRTALGVSTAVFGRVMANREIEEINVFGLYANTVPVFINTEGDFITVCRSAENELRDSMIHSAYPLNCILKDNGIKERCFDMAVSFISAGLLPKFKLSQPKKYFNGHIELPMRLHIIRKKKTIGLNLEYAKYLYSRNEAESFVNLLVNIIITGIDNKKPIYLTKDDKEAYFELNSVKKIETNKTVSRLFSNYANECGNKPAVVYNGEIISFNDIEKMANAIAVKVKECKVVGLRMGRCRYLVAAMIGILKAGAAYMPLPKGIDIPKECDAILTLSTTSEKADKKLIYVDKIDFSSSEYIDYSNSEQAAYLMCTSGSSGIPKIVKISNASLYVRLKWMHDKYHLDRNILQKTNAGFDVSGWELLCGAFGGCCVMIKDGEECDFGAVCRYIDKYKIEMVHFVPSVLRLFLKYIQTGGCSSLQRVISSGEALDVSTVKLFFEKLPGVSLSNLYGPTECTIDVTSYECTGDEDIIPIGKPVYNTKIYISTADKKIAPRGIKGEIVVTGDLVGMGYTAEEGGYGSFADERAYYTGDIGYFGFDGNIYYCGRNDSQVKVNGKRMDLAGIENMILTIESVTSAAVIYDGKCVLAYYSAENPVDDIELRLARYTDRLPSAFIYVKNMQLTTSGKVDKRVLCKIKFEKEIVFPSNETEKIILDTVLAEMTEDKRKCDIGVEDNLFDAGLDSLAALSLKMRLAEHEMDFSVQDIYANPTVRMLAIRQNKPHPLVKLNKHNSDKILCCFPYAGGQPQAFLKMASQCEYEAVGVNYDYFDEKLDVNDIAETICREICDKDEIYLAASCIGSAFALATAKKAEDMRIKIDGIFIMGSLPAVTPFGKNPWRIFGKNTVRKKLSEIVILPEKFSTDSFLRDTDRYFKYMAENKPLISAKGYISFAEDDLFTKGFEKNAKNWKRYFLEDITVTVFKTGNHYFVSETDDILKKMKGGDIYD